MPEFVRVRAKDTGHEYTEGFFDPEIHEKVTVDGEDAPAVDSAGAPLPPKPNYAAAGEQLRGQALDDALDAAGLSKSGTVAEKQQRLAEHNATTEV